MDVRRAEDVPFRVPVRAVARTGEATGTTRLGRQSLDGWGRSCAVAGWPRGRDPRQARRCGHCETVATRGSTSFCWTSWATSKLTHAAPSCCSRSSPNAKSARPSPSPRTCRSANGEPGCPDPRLVAAIVDRVTFNAYVLETGTQSYRLRASKTAARRKRTS